MCRILGSFFGQAVVLLFAVVMLNAADTPQSRGPAKPVYRKPPKVITDILESPAPPMTLVSPSRDRVLVIDSLPASAHRRSCAAHASDRRPAHQSGDQWPTPSAAPHWPEVDHDCRRQRDQARSAHGCVAERAAVVSRRPALHVHQHQRQHHPALAWGRGDRRAAPDSGCSHQRHVWRARAMDVRQ